MPGFWLLDARTGWRTGAATGVVTGADLRLAGTPDGPLGLAAEDGSLGGLIMPTGFALTSDGICYLLDPDGQIIRRFDPVRQAFVPVLGEPPLDPEQEITGLAEVVNIAVAGRLLYVADHGAGRVLAFGLPHLELRHVWSFDGDLADVSSTGTAAYLLDRAGARVWRHVPGEDDLRLIVDDLDHSGRFSRVAVDHDGLIYLSDAEAVELHAYDEHGRHTGVLTDPDELRTKFTAPPIRLSAGVFVLPEGLTHACDRHAEPDASGTSPEPATVAPTGPAFDRAGNPVPKPRPSRGKPPFVRTGEWRSLVLDSRIYRCAWDRLELDVTALPAATSVRVETATFDGPPSTLDDAEWTELGGETGRAHAPGTPAESELVDWPVRSRPGRYLAIRLHLAGPGRATPVLGAIRAYYPRASYLEFLPEIFGADPDAKDFLERFLGSLKVEWDRLDRFIANLPAYVDPKAVPAGAPLKFLASWFGIPLDDHWNAGQQREQLLASLDVLRRRGTPDAIRELLAALTRNLTGVAPTPAGYPVLLEGYRVRPRLSLGQPVWSTVDSSVPLWSPDVVGRFRTPSYAEVGKARLVSTGDPSHDMFSTTANSFRVYLPSDWVRTAEDERVVRRLIVAERPATSRYDLCLVEPRLRVAAQSTVGLDTIVGAIPRAHLACPHDTTAPPSRPPRNRLGVDSVLAAAEPQRSLRVGSGTRIGTGTGIR
jgi:phage tail-like protein